MSNEGKTSMTIDDAALAERCRKGDHAAFETIVLSHQRLLFNTALRMTGVYEDASDIVQETFLAAWRKIADFRGEARLSTWLTAILINLARTRLQETARRNRREAYSLDAPLPGDDSDTMPEAASEAPSVLQMMEEGELRLILEKCINRLSPEFREVLVLRDMQEMGYEEVGTALKIREGTVKSRLFRARDAVKDCMKRAAGKS